MAAARAMRLAEPSTRVANVSAVFSANPSTRPLFQDGAVTAELTTPSILNVGAAWQVTDALQLSATYARTDWSSLREVRIQFDNPDPDSVEPFEWKDTYFAALGAEYKLSDSWKLRGGVAYDQTPTTDAHRDVRVPDTSRKWLSLGVGWTPSANLEYNFGSTHLFTSDPDVRIGPTTNNQGNSLVGKYKVRGDVLAASVNYKF